MRYLVWLAGVSLLGVGPLASAEPAPPPKTESLPLSPVKTEDREGLEGGEWLVEGFGDPAEAAVVRTRGQERNRMLRIEYHPGAAGKAAVKRVTGFRAAETGTLRCWVHCAAPEPPRIALALQTGPAYVWQETPAVQLKAGWNEVRFDLAGKEWKSASSQWKNEAALQDRGDVRSVEFLIFGGASGGVLHVDGLKIDRDGQTPGLEDLIRRLSDDDFGERERAEKALVEAGRAALECLREAAEDGDPETAIRARRVIAKVLGQPSGAPEHMNKSDRE